MIRIRAATPNDFEPAALLLREARLPLDGFREHMGHVLIASRADAVVGCVALEIYENAALFRSLAVAPEFRGQGLGELLTSEALRLARESRVHDVYLLTETAVKFFPRFGFTIEERAAAPAPIQQSVEFRTACPASAVFMHARIDG
ncbi:MAG TPA: arsenic resistance N-acetyltransferase ArsN2 [Thermoanaerobaculia bacterium]